MQCKGVSHTETEYTNAQQPFWHRWCKPGRGRQATSTLKIARWHASLHRICHPVYTYTYTNHMGITNMKTSVAEVNGQTKYRSIGQMLTSTVKWSQTY